MLREVGMPFVPDQIFKLAFKMIKCVFIYDLMFQNHQGDFPEMYIRLYYRMNTFDYKLTFFSDVKHLYILL